ncbi:MAG: YtxH domain-containing protein [Muribaculaceae bacterium]|nr:YtxH domain-containing protein [Muribaculaceae bacterium]
MKTLFTFLAGALAGAAVAALVTPTTGTELRERIKTLLRKKGVKNPTELDRLAELIAIQLEG